MTLDAGSLTPYVTWGTNPGQALPLASSVPDPDSLADPDERAAASRALAYMDLKPGTKLEDIKVDRPYLIPDEEALPVIFDLLEHEGLCLGGSSGINVAGAIRLARELGPGHIIVTVLCDYGTRYQTKLFNPEFLRSKNLPVPDWMERRSTIKAPYEKV